MIAVMAKGLTFSDGRETANRLAPVDLSVVVTCHNHAMIIENTLSDWYLKLAEMGISFEMLVINKGSRDGSGRILDQMRKSLEHLRVAHQLPSMDAPAKLRGFKISRGKFVLFVSLDYPIETQDLETLWNEHENALMVVGRRTDRNDPLHHRPFSFGLKKIVQKSFGCPLSDPASPVQLVHRQFVEVPKETQSIPFSFWLQQLLKVHQQFPKSIKEVPVSLKQSSWRNTAYQKLSISTKILRELIELRLKDAPGTTAQEQLV